MPKVVLVDGVGNGAIYEISPKALPVTITAAGRSFVRTGENAAGLPVYRLRTSTPLQQLPAIRHVSHFVPPTEAAA